MLMFVKRAKKTSSVLDAVSGLAMRYSGDARPWHVPRSGWKGLCPGGQSRPKVIELTLRLNWGSPENNFDVDIFINPKYNIKNPKYRFKK